MANKERERLQADLARLACKTHESVSKEDSWEDSCCGIGHLIDHWDKRFCEELDADEKVIDTLRADLAVCVAAMQMMLDECKSEWKEYSGPATRTMAAILARLSK
jgi:hypothetical protein